MQWVCKVTVASLNKYWCSVNKMSSNLYMYNWMAKLNELTKCLEKKNYQEPEEAEIKQRNVTIDDLI